jgi:hypothetical protein
MLFDPQGVAVKEALVLRTRLISLMRLLDADDINGIVYGLPDTPLSKQQVHQLIRVVRPHTTPHYAMRILSQCVIRNELKFPDDIIGRQDAIDEFVDRCASRKAQGMRHLGKFPDSPMSAEAKSLTLFTQETLIHPRWR